MAPQELLDALAMAQTLKDMRSIEAPPHDLLKARVQPRIESKRHEGTGS